MVDGRWLRWLKIHGRARVIEGMHGEEGNIINNNFIMNLTKDPGIQYIRCCTNEK